MSNNRPVSSEAADFVLRVLQQSPQPLGVTKLNKAIPKSAPFQKKQLPELLKQMVKSGQIRAHGTRATAYWLPVHDEQACARIIEALGERPLTQTELRNKFKSLLIGWPLTKRVELVERLVKEKRVYKVPPLAGKSKLLSIRADPTPQDYVKLALQLAVTKLKPLGFTSEHVFSVALELLQRAPGPVPTAGPTSIHKDFAEIILDRMIRLKPAAANGALVSLRELRQSLMVEISSKFVFDQTVLELARGGRVALHHHDHPSSLSQEERDALVLDEHGNYYVGIAIRESGVWL